MSSKNHTKLAKEESKQQEDRKMEEKQQNFDLTGQRKLKPRLAS